MEPSGQQFEIRAGSRRAVVTEVGATLRRYAVDGADVLDGFAETEMASGGRGQLLLPWPNRVRDGAYEFEGRRHQLALSEPDRRNAIHGLARWANWRPLERTSDQVRLFLRIHPQPGYPFLLDLTADYQLTSQGLRVQVEASNRGRDAAPFGCGSHPYLKPRKDLAAGLLHVPARSYLEVDERLIPTGRRLPVEGTPYDFREPRPIGEAVLDTCYADLDEPWVEFDGHRVEWGAGFGFVQLFTGDSLTPEHRRKALAVEAMSCPADAFNSGDGLVTLRPGQTWRGSWDIT